MIEIHFIGTRGEIEERSVAHFHHTATLFTWDKSRLLLDWGESFQEKEPEADALILTHAHIDHIGGLKGKRIEIPIYATRRVRKSDYWKDEDYGQLKINWLPLYKATEVIGAKITPIPIYHSKKAPNVVYLLEFPDGTRIAYATDFLAFRGGERRYIKEVDIFIGDGASLRRRLVRREKETGEIYGHASVSDQLKLIAQLGLKFAIFTHWGKEAVEMGIRKLRKEVKALAEEAGVPKVEIARDSLRLEVGKRGEESSSPEVSHLPAKILVEPHAELIAKGEKTMIVTSRPYTKYIGLPTYVISGNLVWAKVIIGKPKRISLFQFRRLRKRHRISEEERRRWWSGKRTLYAYEVKVLEKYEKEPLRVRFKRPRGAQVWIAPGGIEFIDSRPKEIEVREGEDQGFAELLKEIEDIKKWDPKIRDDQLRDDWRLLTAAYAKVRRGEKIVWSLRDILKRSELVVKELIKRRAIVFHPHKMKKLSRELFERVKEKLNAAGLKFPLTLSRREIQEISPPRLKKLPLLRLQELHDALHRAWAKEEGDETIFNAHLFLVKEFLRRKKAHKTIDSLDIALKKMLKEVHLPAFDLPPIVIVHDALSLCGSAVWREEIHDCDWIIRTRTPRPLLEQTIRRLFPSQKHDFIYEPIGPNWDYIPVGEFVLWPKNLSVPDVKVEETTLKMLLGFKAFFIEEDYLFAKKTDSHIKFYLAELEPNSGVALKLSRLFPDLFVEVVLGLPEKEAEPVASLLFRPYRKLEARLLDEEAFKRRVRIEPREPKPEILIEQKAKEQRLEPLVPFVPMKALKCIATPQDYERAIELAPQEAVWLALGTLPEEVPELHWIAELIAWERKNLPFYYYNFGGGRSSA